jgi:dTMP kinase
VYDGRMSRGEGRFIVIEGIDGCGSTTQAAHLAGALEARGLDVTLTAEPTGGPIGRLIREALAAQLTGARGDPRPTFDWATFALLFAADRADHNDLVIRPALATGSWVISDRYDLSSLAYQSLSAAGQDDVLDWIRQLNAGAQRPDLTVVLDVEPAVAAERRRRRGGPGEIFDVEPMQRRLAELYRAAETLVPRDRVVHVSSDGAVETVAAAVLASVSPLFGSGGG